jgi:hypothetical protein
MHIVTHRTTTLSGLFLEVTEFYPKGQTAETTIKY